MKPEHWQRLDQLFHSALGRAQAERAEFLDKASAGDDSLRKEVEALLSAHEEAGSFIESPALDVEARSLANDQNESVVGQTIGHYKIISSIGGGGMGEVYLAQDTRLGRKVALKLLPAAFTQDSERVLRFQREARAASALNHPNIITIHEIGQAEDRQFIATEFIDGETLRQRITGSQLPSVQDRNRYAEAGIQLSAVLSVGMQIADALAAAHAKGIVHRDIKPENIILVEDSHLQQKESFVKVLDFGIAKLVEPVSGSYEATTRVLLSTHEGSVMGTAGYMSPEQARGEKVDGRTDIWSLGIVLYEMLSNALPFVGDTAQDVIASILKEEPPPLPLEVPDRLRWIVEKALRKNKEERYQTAREMFSDLRDLQGQLREIESTAGRSLSARAYLEPDQARVVKDHGPAVTTMSSPARATSSAEYIGGGIKRLGKRAVVGLAALVIGLGGLALGLYKYISWNQSQNKLNQTKPAPFQTMKITRLTSTGKASGAAISPDGKYVVHAVDDGKQASLWMRQVLTSSNVEINPPDNVSYAGMTFSPDGDYLYYISWDKKSPFVLYQMPVLGGASRKLITNIDSNISFSADGKRFAFVRGYPHQGEVALLLANADGTAERKLVTHRIRFGVLPGAAWSPDGKIIAYPVNTSDESGSHVVFNEVRVDDGSEKPMSSRRWWRIGQVAWLQGGSGLVFNAIEHASGPSQIWYLSYPEGQAHRITNDLNNYRGVSLTADSSALVTVESEQHSNIWIAPDDNARRAIQITHSNSDGAEGISWTPDGKIVYASRAGGNVDLWMIDVDGTRQKQVTANAGNNRGPSVSPDGRYIVFVSDRTGTSHVWRSDIDGSNPRQLTNGDGEWGPKCSPDGRWVLYHLSLGKSGIWRVPIDGGEPVQIIEKASGGLSISPDGKWIISALYEPTAVKWAIYPFEGGEPHKILDIFFGFIVRWTPDGSALAYVERRNPSTINSQTVDGGTPKRLSDFSPDRIFSFAWSPDGKQLAIARGAGSDDVVLIRNFKNPQ